jgi:hypothetical protein
MELPLTKLSPTHHQVSLSVLGTLADLRVMDLSSRYGLLQLSTVLQISDLAIKRAIVILVGTQEGLQRCGYFFIDAILILIGYVKNQYKLVTAHPNGNSVQ